MYYIVGTNGVILEKVMYLNRLNGKSQLELQKVKKNLFKRKLWYGVFLLLLFLGAAAFSILQAQTSPLSPPQIRLNEKIALRVLYVGLPDSERQKDFVGFLTPYFKEVKTADVNDFQEEQAKDSDVVVIDSTGIDSEPFNIDFSDQYSRATITMGVPGAAWAAKYKLKIGWFT